MLLRRRVQLTPPGTGGVHDHALALQQAWGGEAFGGEVWGLDQRAAQARPLHERLLTLAPGAPVELLLHFSGYGYGARGLCAWLLQEVKQARQVLGPRLKVVVLFHELFASGPPWRSAFWLAPWQRWLARQLLRHCDAAVTNTEGHLRWLRGAAPADLPLCSTPVFSNVGEPLSRLVPSARPSHLVLFGSRATRDRAAQLLPPFAEQLQALGVGQITEIGPGQSVLDAALPFTLSRLGALDATALSAQLLQHRYALIDYPVRYLGKSGVFAAYAAHGCVVLNTAPWASAADGLEAGVHEFHLSRPLGLAADLTSMDRAAALLTAWYEPHSLQRQATALAALLDGAEQRP